MNDKRSHTVSKPCRLIAWSLTKDGEQRPPICPECGEKAEVGLDMIGRPCYFHIKLPSFPFKPAGRKSGRTVRT